LSKANWLFDFPGKRWAISKRLGVQRMVELVEKSTRIGAPFHRECVLVGKRFEGGAVGDDKRVGGRHRDVGLDADRFPVGSRNGIY
jgi:hypothetical protein